ncbi:uncharacterized protein C19orf85 homolog [Petaurus breviceps papuanus]|uniref:uncharacterized protein C19orf85 homolog n=1 Tax=Petaurus breviceps papuanus TaxID=3040969 RepID=UPI0036DE5909
MERGFVFCVCMGGGGSVFPHAALTFSFLPQIVSGGREMHPGTPATSQLPELAPQELCAFVSGVAARILRTLQPRKARPPRRKPNHRRFLYNQLCRSLADIEEATQHVALTVLSRQGPGPQPNPQRQRPPSPFLGVAQALAAPESPGPGLALSPGALQSPTHELFETISWSPRLQTPEDPSALAQVPPASSLSVQAPHLPPMLHEPAALPDDTADIQYQDLGQCLPYGAPAPLSPRAPGVSEEMRWAASPAGARSWGPSASERPGPALRTQPAWSPSA